jgi:DNA-binding NarL/FixJ family response regulator
VVPRCRRLSTSEAGADIYIDKADGCAELTAALRGLLMADQGVEFISADEAQSQRTTLSKRQLQIMAMRERGLSNREMSEDHRNPQQMRAIHQKRPIGR